MTQSIEELRALANAEAEESGIDMNEAVKGGGGGRLLPAGYAFGRLIEYVELGKQPQEFGGKAKEPCLEYTIAFALWGQGYQNDDGTPYIIRPYSQALSRNDKAGAFLLFKALNWKGTAKNFGQLLGETYLVKIHHVPKSKADQTIVSRIDMKGFLPPLDPVTRQPYAIPDVPVEQYNLFLWNRPTKAAWDKLYIEGQWEAKEGKPAESKNRVQETILGALDYQGSPLQQLLGGAVQALPQAAAPAAVAPQAVVPAAPVAPAVAPVAAPVAPAVAPSAIPAAVAPQVAVPLAAPIAAAPMVAAPVTSVSTVTTSPTEVAAPLVPAPVVAPVAVAPAPLVPTGVVPTAIPAVTPVAVPSSPVLPA